MRPPLPVIALATGAALPASLRAPFAFLANGATVPNARARADKLKATLPPLMDEDVRIIGALAELFAAAAAERLINDGLKLGAGSPVYGRASSEARRKALRPTLSVLALATGAALCSQALAQQASGRPKQGKIARRTPRPPDQGEVGAGRPPGAGRSRPRAGQSG